jgi:hypothetical protein
VQYVVIPPGGPSDPVLTALVFGAPYALAAAYGAGLLAAGAIRRIRRRRPALARTLPEPRE